MQAFEQACSSFSLHKMLYNLVIMKYWKEGFPQPFSCPHLLMVGWKICSFFIGINV